MPTYQRLTFRLAADREDDFATWLGAYGSLGCSVVPAEDGVRLTAYFPARAQPPVDADLAAWGAEVESADALEDIDWLAAYRAVSRPFEVGGRFRIDPGEPDDFGAPSPDQGADDRHLLRIPARTAFGTGSHESTRLCISWLEELAARGRLASCRVLDVGTGSGILALCAERLGARRVAGFDVDGATLWVARDNARRNRCRPALWAGGIESLAPRATFDLALVNVLPERILDAYPALVRHLAEGALVISSGNLTERRGELLGRFAELGLRLEGETIDGEWSAFLLCRVRDASGTAP